MNSKTSNSTIRTACIAAIAIVVLGGCAARQIGDSLAGSTAQKLVTYSIDDVARALPDEPFAPWSGKTMAVRSSFPAEQNLRQYADERIGLELARRFGIEVVADADQADAVLNLFYTSLGTDRDTKGFFLPLGFVPGMDADMRINLLTLEQFQGVAELYFFVGETGTEVRSRVLRARTRSDALGLPVITIPINNIDRTD